MKLNIKDITFGDNKSSVFGKTSNKIKWVSDGSGDPRYQFYTNQQCFLPVNPNVKNILWLTESRGIIPGVYEMLDFAESNFDLILSHSSAVLDRYTQAKWIFGGGSWIDIVDERVYDKSKLCSIVSSDKIQCPQHVFRKAIANEPLNKVDKFGTFNGGEWQPIINSLKDYSYSIIIENFIDEAFWTEKLINCFLTGTIPIYCGATKINDYFKDSGIIKFWTYSELLSILDNISFNDYNSRIDAIKFNFEEAKKYRIMEDYIGENLSIWCK
jgi:hypothetical protein